MRLFYDWLKPFYFSLVELLVVIAVIAILMSILLPSLKKARDRAKTMACQQNLKQFGLANFSYAQDWDGNLVEVDANAPTTGFWPYLLCPYVDYDVDGRISRQNYSIWHCPGANPIAGYAPYRSRGYLINRSIAQNNYTPQQTRKLGRITNPSRLLLMLDGAWDHATLGQNIEYIVISTGGNVMAWADLGSKKKYIIFRHSHQCNVLFVDGHVKTRPPNVPGSLEGVAPKGTYWYEGGPEY